RREGHRWAHARRPEAASRTPAIIEARYPTPTAARPKPRATVVRHQGVAAVAARSASRPAGSTVRHEVRAGRRAATGPPAHVDRPCNRHVAARQWRDGSVRHGGNEPDGDSARYVD